MIYTELEALKLNAKQEITALNEKRANAENELNRVRQELRAKDSEIAHVEQGYKHKILLLVYELERCRKYWEDYHIDQTYCQHDHYYGHHYEQNAHESGWDEPYAPAAPDYERGCPTSPESRDQQYGRFAYTAQA